MDVKSLIDQYTREVYMSVIPFWESHSIDHEEGGFLTCLLRDGTCFDTDKFVWLQARQTWMFAKLYELNPNRTEWLDIAIHGANFLQDYGRDAHGQWYFSLAKNGVPLVQPYNIFSDCFACLAFGQLFKITSDPAHRKLCIQAFDNIMARQDNPKGVYNKTIGQSRPMTNFGLPMILANILFELEDILNDSMADQTLNTCMDLVMDRHYHPQNKVILENVSPDGSLLDTMEGRLVNPGHAIEAMSFMMDIGQLRQDEVLIAAACDRVMEMIDFGWDDEHGGIFYFLDVKGYPTQQLEWDQKLWWVHLETLVALAKGYALTKRPELWNWFERVHQYTWDHFPDPEFGEWFGYLNRRGEVLLPLKGGKWKGCFHVPRSLLAVTDNLKRISMVD